MQDLENRFNHAHLQCDDLATGWNDYAHAPSVFRPTRRKVPRRKSLDQISSREAEWGDGVQCSLRLPLLQAHSVRVLPRFPQSAAVINSRNKKKK